MFEEGYSKSKYILFDGSNFSNWKFRVNALLDEKELSIYVKKDLATICVGATTDDCAKHRRNEKKCKSLLIQCIGDNHLEYVKDKEQAKEIFDTLQNVFERKSVAGQLCLRKKIMTMKFNDGDNIENHFLVFDKTVRELKSTGADLKDIDVVCYLLLSLPKSYDVLVTALETLDQDKLTLEFVKGRLLDEYTKRIGNNSSSNISTNDSVAMNAKQFKFKCYKCGKVGHKKSECRKDSSKPFNRNQKKEVHLSSQVNNDLAFVANTNFDDNGTFSGKSKMIKNNQYTTVKWYLDSGATDHMTNNIDIFNCLVKMQTPITIAVAKNDVTLSALRKGDVNGLLHSNGKFIKCRLENVLFVENLKCNLLSIRKMEEAGMKIIFDRGVATVHHKGNIIAVANRNEKLYEMELLLEKKEFVGVSVAVNDMELWHHRMGHLNNADLQKLSSNNMVLGMENVQRNSAKVCEPCIYGKQTKKPFSSCKGNRSSRVLELIHSDVCGPIEPISWNGGKYYVSFIDDYTHFAVVYIMNKKSEVFEYFEKYAAMCSAQFGTKISQLRSDNGGEYVSNEFKSYCSTNGIQMKFTVPYSPQQNGVAERFNRTIMERARTMIIAAKLEKRFWTEAVTTATYLINRSPTAAFNIDQRCEFTPAELWYGKKPNLSNLKVFGSSAFRLIPDAFRKKLDDKSIKNIMVGYATNGYRLWDSSKKNIIIARNVVFDESVCLSNHKAVVDISETEFEATDDEEGANSNNPEEVTLKEDEFVEEKPVGENFQNKIIADDSIPLCKTWQSKRERRQPERFGKCSSSDMAYALNAELFVDDSPVNLSEAKQRDDWEQWKLAIDDEMDALARNKTWTLTSLPAGRKTVKCRWVFKIKKDERGDVQKYKARLVAKGFTQKHGFDYSETYSPVAKLTTFRVLLAIANHQNLFVHQMDVKSAFLQGILTEEIYMEMPEGFRDGEQVCKLNKSLYGLKQSSRLWNNRFHAFMIKIGFHRSEADYCLYIRIQKSTTFFLLLYVDDVLLVSNNIDETKAVMKLLAKEFEMADMMEVKYFLGFHVERDRNNNALYLSQKQYLINVLRKFQMYDCKCVTTPMESKLQLKSDSNNNQSTSNPYRELIGCLMYVTLTTRPDLSAATNYFSRFQSDPSDEHFVHAKRILRYIKGTLDLKLKYIKDDTASLLHGYADADWAGDENDRKSTSGFVFKVYGSTVSWLSRKQATVSLSSTEAEYVALAEAACEAIWLQNLLKELEMKFIEPTIIFEDNQSCILIAEEPRGHKRLKHIDVKYNFIREVISSGKIGIKYIPSKQQTADIMTKGLSTKIFVDLRKHLGLSY